MGRVSAELGRRIYLDTNIVIYAVEGFTQYATQIQALLDAMDTGEVSVVTSELTLAEVLVGPLKTQNIAVQQTYRSFLTSTATFVVPSVSRDILKDRPSCERLRNSSCQTQFTWQPLYATNAIPFSPTTTCSNRLT